MSTYTIQNVMPTGKTHEQYGTEYYVKFNGSAETFRLWYKTAPTEGQEVEGTIEEGQYGPKFVKTKKEFTSSATNSGAPSKRTYGAVEKDKQDGMRQGMCLNNAANSLQSLQIESDVEWATRVHARANALYAQGDLTGELTGGQNADSVQKVFSPSPANPGR